jgi:hypothetical protein
MKKIILIFLAATVVFQGCMGYKSGVVEAPNSVVKQSMEKAINNIHWETKPVPKGTGIITGDADTAEFKKVDIVVIKERTNNFNNTGTSGYIALTPVNDSITAYDAVFQSLSGDAEANANLLFEITKQQIAIDQGLQKPFTNPVKSKGTYIALTALSPFLSANYLADGNPLISPSSKKWLYIQNGIGDIFFAGSLIGGAAHSKNFGQYIAAGFSVSLIWKFLVLLNITDINDYNIIAGSHYRLDKIWDNTKEQK